MAVKQMGMGPRPGGKAGPAGVEQQARERIELGKELLSAAEAYSARQAAAVEALRQEQAGLREEIQREVSQSLRTYDQTVGALERRLTERMEALEQTVEALGAQWRQAHEFLTGMVRRCETLMDQSRVMLERSEAGRLGSLGGQRAVRGDSAGRAAAPPTKGVREVGTGDNTVEETVEEEDGPPPLIYTQAVELLRGRRPQGV